MTDPYERPRRLRTTPAMRRLVRETRLHPSQFVLPVFLREGLAAPTEIAGMPGVVQHSRESLKRAAAEAVAAGGGGIMVFGVPQGRDASAVEDETCATLRKGLRSAGEGPEVDLQRAAANAEFPGA